MRNGWEHYDLEKEMLKCNIAQLLELYKTEYEKYLAKCKIYFDSLPSLTKEGKKKMEEECALCDEARTKVALRIVEQLTDTKKR